MGEQSYTIECKTNGDWLVYNDPITLRQWIDLLIEIYGDGSVTADNQYELALCLKEQGFEI